MKAAQHISAGPSHREETAACDGSSPVPNATPLLTFLWFDCAGGKDLDGFTLRRTQAPPSRPPMDARESAIVPSYFGPGSIARP